MRLSPLVACRLVALDKNPGVRPIGVGEVVRRIVMKAILRVIQRLVEEACGVLQTCSGLPCGIEAAVHAMRETYAANSTEGILLVDAKNAFNSLNREAALHNIQHLCPAISTLACNTYGAPARLFVFGGGELASQEGTTQGEPLSMALYALSILPMQGSLLTTHPQTMQLWYADDSGAAGRLCRLRAWWDSLIVMGPKYGYHPNCHKTKLLVKPDLQQQAEEFFGGTGITVVTDGVTYLGSPIGTPEYVAIQAIQAEKKVAEWSREINRLALLAVTEPHAAYAVLTHGLYGRWTYHFRTMEFPPDSLLPLVDAIVSSLLPALTGRDSWPEIALQQMFLPVRCGGLGLTDVVNVAASEYTASIHVCAAYMNAILQQTAHPPHQPKSLNWSSKIAEMVQEIRDAVPAAKAEVKLEKRAIVREKIEAFQQALPTPALRALSSIQVKGASSWLSVVPLHEHGFSLAKGDFRDALALHFSWPLQSVPTHYVCGKDFSTPHAMVCPRGGFTIIRHEVRDLLASQLTEIYI